MTCILVVEDESEIREMIVEVLRGEGFQIVEAPSADAAIELLAIPSVRLIVTDINMPGQLDGIDLAIAARKLRPDIPVIFISGRFSRLADASCALTDYTTFLQKPFSLKALIKDVERFACAE
jgi:CheY-like chemotaxis protein